MESPREGAADYDSMNFDRADAESLADDGEDPFSRISELMMSNQPEAIPDVFSSPPPKRAPRRKGAAVLVIVAVVVTLSSLGAGLYLGRDFILDHFAGLGKYYAMVGVQPDDIVGYGLAFRNCASDRTDEGNNEVLTVRGVIENTTAQARDIPLLRLVLYNNKTVVQEKTVSPPQTSLKPKETVGFSLTVDQPDASATRFEITFAVAKPADSASPPVRPGAPASP